MKKKKKPKNRAGKKEVLQVVTTRRWMGISVHKAFLAEWMKNSIIQIEDSPIPKDAKFVDVYKDDLRDRFVVIFEHDSFGDIEGGATIPIWLRSPTYARLYELEAIYEKSKEKA